MAKKFTALLLALLLLLPGCKGKAVPPTVSADDALESMLAAAPEGTEGPEIADGETLDRCLVLYGVSAGQVVQCAAARMGGARVFELAVLQAVDSSAAADIADALTTYAQQRWAAFGGYAPDQAAIAENALVTRHGDTWVLLILSEDPDAVYNAFLSFLKQEPSPAPAGSDTPAPSPAPSEAPEPVPAPTETAEPSPEPTETTEPSPEPTPEPSPEPSPEPDPEPSPSYPSYWRPYMDPEIDDMTEYDNSAVVTAWRSGDSSGLSRKDRELLEAAEAVVAEVITDGMSDYEKEFAIYRWIVTHVSYDYTHYDNHTQLSPSSSTPYNPLIQGKGICLGFSTTFQLFMDMLDVECITVIGAANRSLEDHAWNMVRLNGAWYCVDSTWDAGKEDSRTWYYFNVTSDYLARHDHQWDYANVPLADTGGKGL